MTGGRLVGVDVGGTFTDVFTLDAETGVSTVGKVPTTRPDQSAGFAAAIGLHADAAVATGEVSGAASGEAPESRRFEDISFIAHGTTTGTNALLERKGAKTGAITTEGFRDTLEMRRRDRPRTWGLRGDFVPIVPRDLRLEVPERVLADGTVETPVDLDAVREAGRGLRDAGCEAAVVLFVNAYANSENEAAAAAALREIWPNEHVACSSEILPEIREFERFSTTALNGYLQPEVGGYLARIEAALSGGGFRGRLGIVQSNGGIMSVDTACRVPVRTALSGPAAGVIAARYIAECAGFDNVITGDVGGTSFDVSLVADGQAAISPQVSVDFGLVIRSPMIEIATIGAGGGSVAAVDSGGLLRIGPESVGSDPGPVAYGRGGDLPTVTDANIVLGRIDPERPIGAGLGALDVEGAREAIGKQVGEPLGLDALDAAEAIVRVANSRMAGAIRLVSIERGYDPERFTFMPFGGGGALHAGAMIGEVGLGRALVPRYPGVTSAMGCVIADMRQDFVQTVGVGLDAADMAALAERMQEHMDAGNGILDESGTEFESREARFALDMAYAGQSHTVPVPLDVGVESGRVAPLTREGIETAFVAAYQATSGRPLSGIPIRILNLRSSVSGIRPKFDLLSLAPSADSTLDGARRPPRKVYAGGEWREAGVFDRLALPVGASIEGPAVLEQPDATTYVDPGLVANVDRFGNVLVERIGGQPR